MRAYLLKIKDSSRDIYTLQRAVCNAGRGSFQLEMRLSPGRYCLMLGAFAADPSQENLEKKYSVIVHSTTDLQELNEFQRESAEKIMGGVLSNLSSRKGESTALVADNSVRRYCYPSRRMGLCIISYVNRSPSFYNVVDEMDVKGIYLSNKNLDEGRLRISLPPNSKRLVVFRYEEGSGFELAILRTAIAIRT